MSQRQVIELKERSMVELLAIVVVMGVLAVVFIKQFFKQEQNITAAAFETLAQSFASKVQVVHGQWLMDKQPNIVRLKSWNEANIEMVTVNKKGWLDSPQADSACQTIWFLATGAPLIFMNNPVSVVEMERIGEKGRVCQYVAGNAQRQYSFEYSSDNGKVTF